MLNGLTLKAGRITTAILVATGSLNYPGGAFSLTGQGVKSGDLFVAFIGTSNTLSLNGVAVTPIIGVGGRFFLKVLTQQEIDAGGTTNTGAWWLVIRGPSAGSIRASGSANGTGPTLTGFTKSQFTAALIYGGSASGATAQPFISQPGYTSMGYYQSGLSYVSAAHNLTPSTYSDGASIPTSGSSNGTTSANILEITF